MRGDGRGIGGADPVAVQGVKNVVGVAFMEAEGGHSRPAAFAWQKDGKLFAWGRNVNGQLGWSEPAKIPATNVGTP